MTTNDQNSFGNLDHQENPYGQQQMREAQIADNRDEFIEGNDNENFEQEESAASDSSFESGTGLARNDDEEEEEEEELESDDDNLDDDGGPTERIKNERPALRAFSFTL